MAKSTSEDADSAAAATPPKSPPTDVEPKELAVEDPGSATASAVSNGVGADEAAVVPVVGVVGAGRVTSESSRDAGGRFDDAEAEDRNDDQGPRARRGRGARRDRGRGNRSRHGARGRRIDETSRPGSGPSSPRDEERVSTGEPGGDLDEETGQAADTAEGFPTFSLDEVVERTGIPARTVRFYQSEKLLPKPERDPTDGRVARYSEAHVERLALIGELRDRGLKLPAIRDLVRQTNSTSLVTDWLGLDSTLRGKWRSTTSRLVDQAEMDRLLDGTPRGSLGFLVDEGLVTRQGDGWLIPNAELAELAVNLVRGGVAAELVVEAGNVIRRNFAKAADQLVALFADVALMSGASPEENETMIAALRPVVGDAARIILGEELERAISTLLSDPSALGKR